MVERCIRIAVMAVRFRPGPFFLLIKKLFSWTLFSNGYLKNKKPVIFYITGLIFQDYLV